MGLRKSFIELEREMRKYEAATGVNSTDSRLISLEDVRIQARELSISIFEDWDLLKNILYRHESTIHKRWHNKTKNQRVDVLLSAWPKMAVTHRPDFAAFCKENDDERFAGTKFKESYLWPYINLEDLSKPKALPLFLDTRARNSPYVFAIADKDATRVGWVAGAIRLKWLNGYTMVFTDQKSPDQYFELIAWKDNADAFDWMETGKGMLPGEGLVLLKIQQRLMRFLVDCCKGIMHDVAKDRLIGDEYPIQPLQSLVRETVHGFPSRALMAAEAPYRPPADMDLERLESLFSASLSAAEDHIMALREDPAYFAESLLQVKEHKPESIKDIRGQEHPRLQYSNKEIFWHEVIGTVVLQAYLALEAWAELLGQVRDLRRKQKKYEATITIGKDLPDEYLTALVKFRACLLQVAARPIRRLTHGLQASPPLRTLFVRESEEDSTSTWMSIGQKPDVSFDRTEKHTMWLFTLLCQDKDQLSLFSMHIVVDELERLIQSERKAKAMISSHISDIIGELAVITEGLRQLELYKPWSVMFDKTSHDKYEDIKQELNQLRKRCRGVIDVLRISNRREIAQLGDPTQNRFYYPVEKRRTKENVEAMRTAERNLDVFWSKVDENLETPAASRLEGTALEKLMAQPKALCRTPAWVEPVKDHKHQEQADGVDAICKPLSELYFDLEHRTERTVDHSRDATIYSTKTKTRGVPVSSTNVEAGAAPSTGGFLDGQSAIFVDARALRVFRTLFYTPSLNGTPGELAWTDFLHAMVSAGFEAEKLYGSVWQFQPIGLDVARSIQFHEPHPSGKLAYHTARRFGRRLERAYGWVGSVFQLGEKSH